MRPTALRILFCVFSIWSIQSVHAQGPKKKKSSYILFTGLVLTSDSLKPIPYVNIRSNRRGLIGYSDVNGYFDVVVKRGDTIFFEQVEKVSSYHVVPDTLKSDRYHVVKLLTQDTLHLSAIFIKAMPLKTLFYHEFVHGDIPDDALERARKNLESEAIKEELRLRPADAHATQSLLTQKRAQQMYYYQQAPPQNYLSPVAWMQFFEAWKRGDFKKKKKRNPYKYQSPY
ncbi:MAG: carboxypeptidase-like regulatory domain-containing protein [Bacteroidia bacterium]|jgi:hypothetical protein|nr:carboxypeptidase-like regulatory domain-containing protein [Bacteroidia bacterium]